MYIVHSKAFLQLSSILRLPPLPALLTRLQYYCTFNAQCTTPYPTPLVFAIHHTILAMEIWCKGQPVMHLNTSPLVNNVESLFFGLRVLCAPK